MRTVRGLPFENCKETSLREVLRLISEVLELNWELEAYSASRCVRVLSGMLRGTLRSGA